MILAGFSILIDMSACSSDVFLSKCGFSEEFFGFPFCTRYIRVIGPEHFFLYYQLRIFRVKMTGLPTDEFACCCKFEMGGESGDA